MAEHDSIDRHIAYWSPGLPDMDPRLEGVVTRMQMLVRHLGRRKEAALAAQGLKQWEYEILWWLRAAGEPYRLTPTTLAEALDTHRSPPASTAWNATATSRAPPTRPTGAGCWWR